jgi:hypothetical protein
MIRNLEGNVKGQDNPIGKKGDFLQPLTFILFLAMFRISKAGLRDDRLQEVARNRNFNLNNTADEIWKIKSLQLFDLQRRIQK